MGYHVLPIHYEYGFASTFTFRIDFALATKFRHIDMFHYTISYDRKG